MSSTQDERNKSETDLDCYLGLQRQQLLQSESCQVTVGKQGVTIGI